MFVDRVISNGCRALVWRLAVVLGMAACVLSGMPSAAQTPLRVATVTAELSMETNFYSLTGELIARTLLTASFPTGGVSPM